MNGTVWQAFRPSNPQTGNQPRLGLVVSPSVDDHSTDRSELARPRKLVFPRHTPVARLWIDSFDAGGFAYVERVHRGNRVALVLYVSDPEKIELFEQGFGLPA